MHKGIIFDEDNTEYCTPGDFGSASRKNMGLFSSVAVVIIRRAGSFDVVPVTGRGS